MNPLVPTPLDVIFAIGSLAVIGAIVYAVSRYARGLRRKRAAG